MAESKYLNVLVGARVDKLVSGLKKALKKVKAVRLARPPTWRSGPGRPSPPGSPQA